MWRNSSGDPNLMTSAAQRMPEEAGGVTIVMPTYNHGRFISDALDSVFAQSLLPSTVLVLDDASTDGTADVVRPYLGRLPHVDYSRMATNGGVIRMLNAGLEKVKTEYVVFLAADDMLDPAALEKCRAVMNENPQAAVCGVLARYIATDKRVLPTPALFDFGSRPRFWSPDECLSFLHRHGALFGGNGAMYRTAMLREAGGFAAELRSFCDGFRIQQLALGGGVCIVPEVLASWRQHADTYAATHRADPAGAMAIVKAVEAELAQRHSPFPPAYAARLRGRLRFAAALAAVARRPVDEAVLRQSLAAYPGVVAGAIVALARFAGTAVAKATLALLLRPFDIPRALRRRPTPVT